VKIALTVPKPRPYFAELPYYLWGEVNYNSEGNCRQPTDQNWTELEVTNRVTREQVSITGKSSLFTVESEHPELAARTALLLIERSSAAGYNPATDAGIWSHADALARTVRIRAEFPRPELKPFDTKLFWGSWKWVGWYATDFAWVGRWIMNSLLTRDTRAVFLCIGWLNEGTFHADQSAALRTALSTLTGRTWPTDKQWIEWYEQTGQIKYPEPDMQAWLEDLKRP
jgi:hypothetical protein